MKMLRSVRGFAVVGLLCLPLIARDLHAASRPKTLIDFGSTRMIGDPTGSMTIARVFDYAWNDWQGDGLIDLRGKGTLIRSKTGKGNLGQEGTRIVFDRSPALEFQYVVGADNQAKSLTFKLVDQDGTEGTWTIPLEGRPRQQLSTVRFDLAKPDNVKGGKKPGLDVKRIDKWEITGDWQDAPTEVLLVKLVTAP